MAKPEHPQNQDRDRFPNLTRDELREIERRFRARRGGRTGGILQRRPPSTFGRRLLVWCAALAVLAILVVLLTQRAQDLGRGAPPPMPARGELAPVLGANARLPRSCREAKAYYAALDHLAPGSEAAQLGQQQTVADERLPLEIVNSIGMRFRLIPAGTYTMGSPPDETGRGADELPHVVAIPRPFYLGKYEVTQEQWMAVMSSNPADQQTGPDHPVEAVSWYDCQEFIKELTAREGLRPGSYLLPSEEEWEYACRAGTRTPWYCGTDELLLRRCAEYKANREQGHAAVGRKLPNAFGLYNMHGNVWEWCRNNYYHYRTGVRDRQRKSLRGGNWYVPETDCRSASRYRYTGTSLGTFLGFRLVRTIRDLEGPAPEATE